MDRDVGLGRLGRRDGTGAVRRAVRLATALLLVAFLVGSWVPFVLDPPSRVENRLEALDDGLRFRPISLATAPSAASWFRGRDPADEVRVRLRVSPGATRQFGPARILVLASDLHNHALLIGQQGDDLTVRSTSTLRGREASDSVTVPGVLVGDRWHDVEVVLRSGQATVTVDGRSMNGEVATDHRRLPPGTRLSLGAETSGNYPWTGRVAAATVQVGDETHDLLAPEVLDAREVVWHLPARLDESGTRTSQNQLRNAALHIALTLLLGAGLGASAPRARRPATIMLGWALLVVLVNLLKIGVATRHPSLGTALVQLGGGWIGIAAIAALRSVWPPPRELTAETVGAHPHTAGMTVNETRSVASANGRPSRQ